MRVLGEDESWRRYVVEEEYNDGRLLLCPDTSHDAIMERAGARPMTRAEFDRLIARHVLPSDGEG